MWLVWRVSSLGRLLVGWVGRVVESAIIWGNRDELAIRSDLVAMRRFECAVSSVLAEVLFLLVRFEFSSAGG